MCGRSDVGQAARIDGSCCCPRRSITSNSQSCDESKRHMTRAVVSPFRRERRIPQPRVQTMRCAGPSVASRVAVRVRERRAVTVG